MIVNTAAAVLPAMAAVPMMIIIIGIGKRSQPAGGAIVIAVAMVTRDSRPAGFIVMIMIIGGGSPAAPWR